MDILGLFGLGEESDKGNNAESSTEFFSYANVALCPPPDRYELWDEEDKAAVGRDVPVASNRLKLVLYSQKPKWATGSILDVPQYGKLKKITLCNFLCHAPLNLHSRFF